MIHTYTDRQTPTRQDHIIGYNGKNFVLEKKIKINIKKLILRNNFLQNKNHKYYKCITVLPVKTNFMKRKFLKLLYKKFF